MASLSAEVTVKGNPITTETKFENSFSENVPDITLDTFIPRANVLESQLLYTIILAVPGYSKTDLEVSIDDKNTLNISGVLSENKTDSEPMSYIRKEYSQSSFKRSFHLPGNTVNENMNATYQNGILKITIPKDEVSSTKPVREISVR